MARKPERLSYRTRTREQGSGLAALVKALSGDVPRVIGELSTGSVLLGADTKRRARRGPADVPYVDAGHEHAEIACVIRGACLVKMGAKWFEAKEGDVCIFPSQLEHSDTFLKRSRSYSLLWFSLGNDEIGSHLTRYSRSAGFNVLFRTFCDTAVSAPRLMKDLSDMAASGPVTGASLVRLKACLLELCSLVLNHSLQMGAKERGDWRSKMVDEVMEHIRDHYPESPSLAEISDHVRLSPNYLCSLFRKHTGQTIFTFLNSIRMKKAEELLLGTTLSVKEIAKQTGFRSAHYFSRTFRRIHGTSPSVFRERHG
ncbi:MAG: AraC family transcriptional regulator [Planctomycetes bacterium]|nr:AraC family transcriptional regulator [Planctomycetota bacterium]